MHNIKYTSTEYIIMKPKQEYGNNINNVFETITDCKHETFISPW